MNLVWGLALAWLVGAPQHVPVSRAVAITIDDLPAAGANEDPALTTGVIRALNAAILATLRAHHVPATGLVNERGVAEFPDAAARRSILSDWLSAGMDLGNHTYSHVDLNLVSADDFERDVEKGEGSIGPIMRRAGKKLANFRFPYNHTGDTQEKHDAVARYLADRGYKLAACTIENEDYEFERAFRVMLTKQDVTAAERLRADYLQYTATENDYYAGLHRELFGRETPQVMLLHANRLNAELLDQILRMFESRGYRFVTLSEAQADPAFRTPETFVTKFGPMWGYRWANVLRKRIDGSKESEPPDWIEKYGR